MITNKIHRCIKQHSKPFKNLIDNIEKMAASVNRIERTALPVAKPIKINLM